VNQQVGWSTTTTADFFAFVYATWIEFGTTGNPSLGSDVGGSSSSESTVTLLYQLSGCKMAVIVPATVAEKLVVLVYMDKTRQDHVVMALKNHETEGLHMLCTTRQPYQVGNINGSLQKYLIL
jgi:hypothetical protein